MSYKVTATVKSQEVAQVSEGIEDVLLIQWTFSDLSK